MSNFGILTMPAPQIWSCHVTQEANFEKILLFANFSFNIRKSYKIFSRKALYFRSYQPKKPHGGWKTPPPPSAFRVKEVMLFYQNSLQRQSFVKLRAAQLLYLVIKLTKTWLYQRLVRDENLREVSVSNFFVLIITLMSS